MAYDADTSLYDASVMLQQEQLKRRRAALAEQMRESTALATDTPAPGVADGTGWTSAVTGTPMVGTVTRQSQGPAILGALTGAAQQYQSRQLDRQQSDLDRRAFLDARSNLGNVPEETQVDGPPDPNGTYPTRVPSLSDRMAYALKLKMNPLTADLGNKYAEEMLVNAPTKEATRKWEAYKFAETVRHNAATEGRPIAVPGVGVMDPRTRQVIEGTAPPATLTPITNPQTGDVSTFNTKTGTTSPAPGGQGAGAKSGDVIKQELDATTKVTNAKQALVLLNEAEPLLGIATSSGIGSLRDTIAAQFGVSTKAGDAAGDLATLGANLVKYADRSGLGPQFSDADRKFLTDSVGGLGDPTVPESRKRAVLARVRKNFQAQAGEDTSEGRSASGQVRDSAPPREAPAIVLPKDKATATAIYQRLPDGAPYVDPNGVKRYKGR